jgi:hypothetical protein
MSTTQQNLISLAIILIVVAFIGWIGQKPLPTPTGVVSLNSNVQVDIAKRYTEAQVNLYKDVPLGAQAIGSITAELAFDPNANEQQQIEEMLAFVRTQAANAGANGVVVNIFAPRGQVLYFSGQLFKS